VENIRVQNPDGSGDAAASPSVSSLHPTAGRGRGVPRAITGNSNASGVSAAAGAAGFAASNSGRTASPAVAAAASSSASSVEDDESGTFW